MSVSFSYPWSAPTSVVELRDPQLDDALVLDTKVVFKTMMDGSLRSYRRTPVKQRRQLEFVGISRTKALMLIAFLTASQGSLVRYIDFDGVNWRGFILTDPEDLRTAARGLGNEPRPEEVRFGIAFEGVVLS